MCMPWKPTSLKMEINLSEVGNWLGRLYHLRRESPYIPVLQFWTDFYAVVIQITINALSNGNSTFQWTEVNLCCYWVEIDLLRLAMSVVCVHGSEKIYIPQENNLAILHVSCSRLQRSVCDFTAIFKTKDVLRPPSCGSSFVAWMELESEPFGNVTQYSSGLPCSGSQ